MKHNGWVPRDFWLRFWEKEAVINFHLKNPLEGCRRLTFVMLTFMMLDQDVVAVSRASVWRVLSQAGLLWKRSLREKVRGFSSRRSRINTGTPKFPISTCRARSTTSKPSET